MKKMTILFFVFALGLTSCNSYLDRSILKPLSLSELKEESNDSLFLEAYRYTQHVTNDVLTSDVDKVKYSDITYREIKELIKDLVNSSDEEQLKKEHPLAFEFFNLLRPEASEIERWNMYNDSISNLYK